MATRREFLNGTCERLLLSPKGCIEGALVKVKGKRVQLSCNLETGDVLFRSYGPGKKLRVLATADHSPKTEHGEHPVYEFDCFADAAGKALKSSDGAPGQTTITGVVAQLHFARHGQPNGVILETGEFLHLRPHGMAQTGLSPGAKVTAVGEVRMTVFGTRMLEAHRVNRVAID
jgi:hypothetical protein